MKLKLFDRIKTTKGYVAQIIEIRETGEFYIKANMYRKTGTYEGIAWFNALGREKHTYYGDLRLDLLSTIKEMRAGWKIK